MKVAEALVTTIWCPRRDVRNANQIDPLMVHHNQITQSQELLCGLATNKKNMGFVNAMKYFIGQCTAILSQCHQQWPHNNRHIIYEVLVDCTCIP